MIALFKDILFYFISVRSDHFNEINEVKLFILSFGNNNIREHDAIDIIH